MVVGQVTIGTNGTYTATITKFASQTSYFCVVTDYNATAANAAENSYTVTNISPTQFEISSVGR